MIKSVSTILMIIIWMIIVGCSQSGNYPVTSDLQVNEGTQITSQAVSGSNEFLLGYYDVYFDLQTSSFEAVLNRNASFTLNIVPFLNKMAIPKNGITFDSIVIHNDDPAFLGVDVTFSVYHPFPGYPQYDAYDMRGVLIGNGADVLEYGGLRTAEHTVDLWMKNPDGYTRWFNPTEFTTELIFGYAPGGYQNLAGDATLNPYKYYGKHLGADDNLWSWLTVGPNYDGVFENGSGRRMEIEFPMPPDGLGIMFGYAVVVSWEEQGPVGPYHAVHCPEPIAATATQTPDAWYDPGTGNSGGNLILDIDLFAWDEQPSTVKIESTVLDGIAEFDFDTHASPGGENYSTWHVEAPAAALTSNENHYYWVIAEDADNDYKNGLPEIPSADGALAAFFKFDCQILDVFNSISVLTPNGGESWPALSLQNITWSSTGSVGDVDIYYSKDDFVSDINEIVSGAANTGIYSWDVPFDLSTTVKIKVAEVGGTGIEDVSDDYFEIGEPVCNFGSTGFTLDVNQSVPTSWSYVGIVASQHSANQTIFAVSSGDHHNLNAYDANNLAAGPIATYDTGDLIYCNNSEALWIDAYSMPDGVDRVLFNNFGGGSPTPGYQLHSLDWDGSTFSNYQTLPKPGSSGIWNLCVTPEGDIIFRNAQYMDTSFYKLDKSNGYAATLLFVKHLADIPIMNGGYIKEIRYDSVLDAIILLVGETDVSSGGQLYALDMTGGLIFSDTDVFNSPAYALDYNMGLDIDQTSPYCRIVAFAGGLTSADPGNFARYSYDLDEKALYTYPVTTYGPARGTLGNDGILWTTAANGSSRFYSWNPPPDW